jgi:hypothetical protein
MLIMVWKPSMDRKPIDWKPFGGFEDGIHSVLISGTLDGKGRGW